MHNKLLHLLLSLHQLLLLLSLLLKYVVLSFLHYYMFQLLVRKRGKISLTELCRVLFMCYLKTEANSESALRHSRSVHSASIISFSEHFLNGHTLLRLKGLQFVHCSYGT